MAQASASQVLQGLFALSFPTYSFSLSQKILSSFGMTRPGNCLFITWGRNRWRQTILCENPLALLCIWGVWKRKTNWYVWFLRGQGYRRVQARMWKSRAWSQQIVYISPHLWCSCPPQWMEGRKESYLIKKQWSSFEKLLWVDKWGWKVERVSHFFQTGPSLSHFRVGGPHALSKALQNNSGEDS